ncbi:hypothetical protein CPC16_004650, partial [Podila verticillata]
SASMLMRHSWSRKLAGIFQLTAQGCPERSAIGKSKISTSRSGVPNLLTKLAANAKALCSGSKVVVTAWLTISPS